MSCPICSKRKPQRFCPAKGEKICAVCCGTEREVTIDCPSECTYLIAARKYEQEHRPPLEEKDVPFADMEVSRDAVAAHATLLNGLGLTVLKYARDNPSMVDSDVREAVLALAETYRTLGSGLYYEKPPVAPVPQGLYAALAAFLDEVKEQEAERAGFPTLKDSDIFHLLVFFARYAALHSNGRSRSRGMIAHLRAQFPPDPQIAKESPRIILP